MSKRDKVASLLGIAQDQGRGTLERLAALDEADAVRREMKTSWSKLNHDDPAALRSELLQGGGAEGFTEATEEELAAQAARPKPETQIDMASGDILEDGQVVGNLKDAGGPKPAKPAKGLPPGKSSERGAISATVRRLLKTDMTYAQIVAEVKRDHPDAGTTARSVASVASDMRQKGEAVGVRRQGAGA